MMKVSVGIDMGGTRIKTGLIADGAIVESSAIPASSHVTLAERLMEMADEVNRLLRKHNAEPIGAGIAFPGIVDSDQKKILSRYVKYPDAQEVDLSSWAMQQWGVPFAIENDARAALLGEWQYGAGKNCDNLVLITLGTGVGSAVLIEGKLLKGKHYLAGNLGGHMTINLHGRKCNCGNIGCVESEASTWALKQYVREEPGFMTSALAEQQDIGFENIFKLSEGGDDFALKVKHNCLNAWATGIINLIHAYDPERVVVGGGVMKSQEAILPFMREKIDNDLWLQDNGVELTAARQPECAGLLGMSYLINTLTSVSSKNQHDF